MIEMINEMMTLVIVMIAIVAPLLATFMGVGDLLRSKQGGGRNGPRRSASRQQKCRCCSKQVTVGEPIVSVINTFGGSRPCAWVHLECAIQGDYLPARRLNGEVKTFANLIDWTSVHTGGTPQPEPEPEPSLGSLFEPEPTPTPSEPLAVPVEPLAAPTAEGSALWGLVKANAYEDLIKKFSELEAKIRNDFDIPTPLVLAPRGTTKVELDISHEMLPYVLMLCMTFVEPSRRIMPMLVGPSGTGKSRMINQIVTALKATPESEGGFADTTPSDAFVFPCNAEMSLGDILGSVNPILTGPEAGQDRWNMSPIVQRYENGGAVLLDEFDALDPAVALMLNNALAGQIMTGRDGRMIDRHKDFVLIAAGNTFGEGRSAVHSARQKMDGAWISRFAMSVVNIGYSPNIEKAVCKDHNLRSALQRYREQIASCGIGKEITTRHLENASILKQNWGHVLDDDFIIGQAFIGWREDDIRAIGYNGTFFKTHEDFSEVLMGLASASLTNVVEEKESPYLSDEEIDSANQQQNNVVDLNDEIAELKRKLAEFDEGAAV